MSIVTRNFTIPAGGEIKIARQADFVRCLDATATITVQFDNGDTADLATGLSYSPEGGFRELTVLNGTASAVTVKLNLGKGQMADNRASVNTSQIMPTREGAPDVIDEYQYAAIPAATSQLLVAADPLTREVIICNKGSYGCFIGKQGGSYPLLLNAGATIVLQTQAAIEAHASASGAVSLGVIATRWSA